MHLTIDDNPATFKKINSLVVDKSVEELVETRSVWVNVSPELILPVEKNECGMHICLYLSQSLILKYYRKLKKRKNKADVSPVIVEENQKNTIEHKKEEAADSNPSALLNLGKIKCANHARD